MLSSAVGGCCCHFATLRKIDVLDGSRIWSRDHGAVGGIRAVEIDPEGNVYEAGYRSGVPRLARIRGGGPGTNEVQAIFMAEREGSHVPTGGTFTVSFVRLSFPTETTGPLAYDATAAAVQTALEALPAIGVGEVICTGGPLPRSRVRIEFTGSLGNVAQQLMTADATALTGCAAVRKRNSAGATLWTADHPVSIANQLAFYGVAVDPASGRVACCGNQHAGVTTLVFEADGTPVWTADDGDTQFAVAFDGSGNVITAGHMLTQRDPAGTILWSEVLNLDVSGGGRALAVDGSDNIYVGGNGSFTSWNARKYNSAGTLVWSSALPTIDVWAAATDAAGNSYFGGFDDLFRLDSAGAVVWTRPHGWNVRALATDGIYVYSGGLEFDHLSFRKWTVAGDLVWAKDYTGSPTRHQFSGVEGIALDPAGYLYVGGSRESQ